MRKMAGEKLLPYKIVDDPSKFSSDDWDNVVAVFATGQDWQFRKWKYSQPVELFQKVLGLHLIYDDRTPELIIQTWNCKLIKVKYSFSFIYSYINHFLIFLIRLTNINNILILSPQINFGHS